MSTIIFDLFNIFKKILQESHLILDVTSARDAAIVNLNIMKEMPVPGGKEENYLKELEGCSHETDERSAWRTNVRNEYIATTNREGSAVRLEVVQSAINFLEQWMNIEQDETINSLTKILDAKSPTELITASRCLVSQMFGPDHVEEFVADVCQLWTKLSKVDFVDIQDIGTVYALRLRKMTQASCGLLKKFLAAFLTLTSHSMATDRAVSHYNNVKTPGRASSKTTNHKLNHACVTKWKRDAAFDPRLTINEFWKRKERHN